jgi:HlyD family secretion protein
MPAGWIVVAAALTVLTVGCAQEPEPDAYGHVEATAVVVSAEIGGRLVSFNVREGERLDAGAMVGEVDDTPLVLERETVRAQETASLSRVEEVAGQVQVLQAQHAAAMAEREALLAQWEIAERAHARTERLVAQQAATAQQLDQAERELRTLHEQVNAQQAQIAALARQIDAVRTQQQSARAQAAAARAQVAQITDRIERGAIRNPLTGTVLVTYSRPGEFVQPGQPLYRIADLDEVEVRAYVTQPQLAGLRLGQPADVVVDVARDERRAVPGTLAWISAEAEFTPTPIQTREQRADLVYAIRIRVPNPDGLLKIGMPAEVVFPAAPEAEPAG